MQQPFAIISDVRHGSRRMLKLHVDGIMPAYAVNPDGTVWRRHDTGGFMKISQLRAHLKHRVSWFQRRHTEQSLLQQVCG